MRGLFSLSGLLLLGAVNTSVAEVSDAEFEALKRQVEANTAAVSNEAFQALKRQVEANAAAIGGRQAPVQHADADSGTFSAEDFQALQQQVNANSVAVDKSDWTQRIKVKGDLRYRYQNDDFEETPAEDGRERDRQRIRARAEIIAEATETITVGFGLATGSDDPVSTNQTIGDFGSSKNINLDLAYFDWKVREGWIVGGGKFKNELFQPGKSQLQWDSDFRPEGFNFRYKNGQWFVNGTGVWLEAENDNDVIGGVSVSDDSTVNGGILQTGLKTEVGGAEVIAGIGYSMWNTSGKSCFDSGDCGRNSHDLVTGVYDFDYEVIDVFAEGNLKVGDTPLKLWAQYITNGDADSSSGDSQDTGVQIGAQLGKASKRGSWQGKVYYQDLEDDATLAFLTNSDFGGGGTGREGIYVGGNYALTDAATLGFSYFMAEQTDPDPMLEQDVDTLQIDLAFKYK